MTKVVLATKFISKVKKAQLEQEQFKESLRKSITSIQKECQESIENIDDRLKKLKRNLQREQLQSENIKFTTKTLSEFDDIDPPVLDIIFEYKLKDMQYQRFEANQIARLFKERDMDPERKVITKIEKEIVANRRKHKKKDKSIDFTE